MKAHARNTDPHTSHEAAASVKDLTATQLHILAILGEPMTDENLVNRYRDLCRVNPLMPWASESGIRSRRNELVQMGMVHIVGHDLTASKRRAHVWQTKNKTTHYFTAGMK